MQRGLAMSPQNHCVSLQQRCSKRVDVSATGWVTGWRVYRRASTGRSSVVFVVFFMFPATLQGDRVLPTSSREKWKHREESDLPTITQLEHSTDGVQPGSIQDTILSLRTRHAGRADQEAVKCPGREKSEQKDEAPGGEGRVWVGGGGLPMPGHAQCSGTASHARTLGVLWSPPGEPAAVAGHPVTSWRKCGWAWVQGAGIPGWAGVAHASGFLCGKLLCSCERIPHSFSGMFGRRMWRKRKLSRPGCRAVRTESLVGPASGLRLGVLDGLRTSRVHPTAESWGAVHSLPGGGKGWGKHRGDQAGVFLSVFHPPNGKEKRHMGPRYERSVEKTSCGFRGVGRKLPTIHSRNDP